LHFGRRLPHWDGSKGATSPSTIILPVAIRPARRRSRPTRRRT
jgi:hypothetical protein